MDLAQGEKKMGQHQIEWSLALVAIIAHIKWTSCTNSVMHIRRCYLTKALGGFRKLEKKAFNRHSGVCSYGKIINQRVVWCGLTCYKLIRFPINQHIILCISCYNRQIWLIRVENSTVLYYICSDLELKYIINGANIVESKQTKKLTLHFSFPLSWRAIPSPDWRRTPGRRLPLRMPSGPFCNESSDRLTHCMAQCAK